MALYANQINHFSFWFWDLRWDFQYFILKLFYNHRILNAFISSDLSTALIKNGYDVNESRNWRFSSEKY